MLLAVWGSEQTYEIARSGQRLIVAICCALFIVALLGILFRR